MKPVETGCASRDGELIALDAIALQAAAQCGASIELICPYRYAAPLAPAAAAERDGLDHPDLRRIRSAFKQLARDSEVMLVEGAGGIAVPITWRENYADLALILELELILVVANRLGCLNSAVLSLDYAARRGVRIKGYVLNNAEPERSPASCTNADSLQHLTSVPCLGRVNHGETVPAEIYQRVIS